MKSCASSAPGRSLRGRRARMRCGVHAQGAVRVRAEGQAGVREVRRACAGGGAGES